MNTTSISTSLLKPGEKNVIILDNIEFGFPEWQLKAIQDDWEEGLDVESIAKKQKRKWEEVFLALFHLARKGKIKRPFAYRF
ncbi:hypothetical protein [Thalassobacillus sp. CUG 92003]|uniref:hypothetical protein n=1 Tax=Thalassobacillus sp. CUG 92003 TaxID=2736641 RepID=UPI0015E6562B|nr:hypothetical protein [Thalassobacillus sp. CUG 92003]